MGRNMKLNATGFPEALFDTAVYNKLLEVAEETWMILQQRGVCPRTEKSTRFKKH